MLKNESSSLVSIGVMDAFRQSFLKQGQITYGIHSFIAKQKFADAIRPNTTPKITDTAFSKVGWKNLGLIASEVVLQTFNVPESF